MDYLIGFGKAVGIIIVFIIGWFISAEIIEFFVPTEVIHFNDLLGY